MSLAVNSNVLSEDSVAGEAALFLKLLEYYYGSKKLYIYCRMQ